MKISEKLAKTGFAVISEKNSDSQGRGRHPNSLAAIAPHCFQPGESGNPRGRPKKVNTMFEVVADQRVPNDPEKRTMLQLVVERIFKAAAKGNAAAAREIADRIDGPARPRGEKARKRSNFRGD
jgi:hypothetical protein